MKKLHEYLLVLRAFLKNKRSKSKTNIVTIIVDLHLGDGVLILDVVKRIIEREVQNNVKKVIFIVNSGLADVYKKELMEFKHIEWFDFTELYDEAYHKRKDRTIDKLVSDKIFIPYANVNALKLSFAINATKRCVMVHKNVLDNQFKRIIINHFCEVCVSWNSRKKMLLEIIKKYAIEVGLTDYQVTMPQIKYRNIETDNHNKYKKYCLVAPGCTDLNRAWEVSKFVGLIKQIQCDSELQIIICGGKEDVDVSDRVSNSLENVINLAGKTTFDELRGLIVNSEYLVANDTGIVHYAIALGAEVFCIGTRQNSRCLPYILDNNNDLERLHVIWCDEWLDCINCEVPSDKNILRNIPNINCRETLKNDGCYYCINQIDVNKVYNEIKKTRTR